MIFVYLFLFLCQGNIKDFKDSPTLKEREREKKKPFIGDNKLY